jgi:hypothetical protein
LRASRARRDAGRHGGGGRCPRRGWAFCHPQDRSTSRSGQ